MAHSKTRNLKLYAEQPPEVAPPKVDALDSLGQLLGGFRQATGWSLQYVDGPPTSRPSGLTWSAPVNPGVGATLGHLRLEPVDSKQAGPERTSVDADSARALAAGVAAMLNELSETRHALWKREAELAAGVPLVPHCDEEKHLAERLEAVLKGGAEAVDAQAAGLYLLDEATTALKLRSSWGLPLKRLTDPARRLQGALGDLEAMLGHAVVLKEKTVMQHWNVPEDFSSAVCVPVSTPTTLLGTLWVFCTRGRDFTDRQTNILEVVAGRLAADLEREMLLREGIDGARWKKQVAAVERLQRNQLPTISPLLDGWKVSGWTAQAEAVGGDFYDWFCLPDGLLAVAVGDAMDRGLAAAMSVNALKAALRAHGQYHRQAERVLKQLNLTLWTGSAGDQVATLFYGLIETATGRVCYSTAGRPSAIVVRSDGWQSLSQSSPTLGGSPELDFEPFGYELAPGEALVIFTDGLRDAADSAGRPLGESGIAEPLVGRGNLSADELVTLVRRTFRSHTEAPDGNDRTVLVIKRTEP
ncbi:MAG TPA: SpoIIE family protein phosphatase [Thermoguttaceae bacterium]|nr:SpoIIE family protein phosphatase [Thermoguttaceae bacterium]